MFLKVISPIEGGVVALIVSVVKFVRFSNAQGPMVVIFSKRVTFLRLVQPLNRAFLSVLGPKVTSSKFSQFSKTQSPKEMTLLGIEAEIRLLQLEKALAPIVVIVSGIVIVLSPLPLKALALMVVTVLEN